MQLWAVVVCGTMGMTWVRDGRTSLAHGLRGALTVAHATQHCAPQMSDAFHRNHDRNRGLERGCQNDMQPGFRVKEIGSAVEVSRDWTEHQASALSLSRDLVL